MLGDNIKNVHANLKLTLKELSRKVNISVKALEKYESGELNIPKLNLKKIAGALNTTEDKPKEESIINNTSYDNSNENEENNSDKNQIILNSSQIKEYYEKLNYQKQ